MAGRFAEIRVGKRAEGHFRGKAGPEDMDSRRKRGLWLRKKRETKELAPQGALIA